MKIFKLCLALLFAPLCGSAAVVVNFYTGTNNLPQEIVSDQIYLDHATGLSEGYAAIRNLAHETIIECDGESKIGFMRFRYGDELCGYFYRASNRGAEDPIYTDYESIESWASVYWMGDGALVDGAQWGSDNYVMMRDESDVMIAVFQFNFDQSNQTAHLIASAIDFNGLTFTQAVTAIQAAAIPEPSTYAAILAVVGLGFVTIARRRRNRSA
jgi:hypothetical protein